MRLTPLSYVVEKPGSAKQVGNPGGSRAGRDEHDDARVDLLGRLVLLFEGLACRAVVLREGLVNVMGGWVILWV